MAEPPPIAPRLKEVADAAGVTRMTVSLALRDHSSLPPTTRRRIQKLARQLGYRPDPDVAMLMEKVRAKKRNRTQSVIAYLTAYEKRPAWKSEPTQRLLFEGARQRASECGYRLEEFWLCETSMSDARLSEIIHHRGIDGAIVAPLPVPLLPRLNGFRWGHVSAVALGYTLPVPALHRACNHQFQSMRLLADKLFALGYRRIGLAMRPDQDDRVNHNWRAGYLVSQSLWNPEYAVPPLMTGKWNCSVFSHWMRKCRPDAVITIGVDVADWLAELGIATPADVGLANVDLRPTMGDTTGIDQNSCQVGIAAVDLLVSLVRHNERGVPEIPRIVMVEGRFVTGRTTRAQP